MKKLIALVVMLFVSTVLIVAGNTSTPIVDCKCKGIPLHGQVRVVEAQATFDVRVVESQADLDVRLVDSFPDECGEWQFVENGEDFTVRFVDFGEDFSIRFVEAFPGVPQKPNY